MSALRRYYFSSFLAVFVWAFCTLPAFANTLVADLSLEEVAITTDFNGENLLLFGAVDNAENDDIIVEFKGPVLKIASRKKEQVSGIWVNRETVNWRNAPSFYHIFSTRAVEDILSMTKQKELGLGHRYLGLRPEATKLSPEQLEKWIEALNRNMVERGLWERHETGVSILRGALFRAPVFLPANILPGEYNVRVLHIRDGVLIAEDKTSIQVAKRGAGAFIYDTAHNYSVFYGLFAIAFAVGAGWLAAAAFRKT
jgi:uncharacterized protein (TIGR02186 family)